MSLRLLGCVMPAASSLLVVAGACSVSVVR
jgi:hypothetical protein